MFALMMVSSIWALKKSEKERAISTRVIRNLAVAQLALVGLTLTTAHVQIITRLASSYPVWMWYVGDRLRQMDWAAKQRVVPFLLVYALIQGGLFASFLPPA